MTIIIPHTRECILESTDDSVARLLRAHSGSQIAHTLTRLLTARARKAAPNEALEHALRLLGEGAEGLEAFSEDDASERADAIQEFLPMDDKGTLERFHEFHPDLFND